MGTAKYVFTILAALLLLGAEGCDVKTKADIIEIIPEIERLAYKFDIQKNGNRIRLTTYDDFVFPEAVALLKTTPMNKPVSFSRTSQGELGTEITEKNISGVGV
jgi:hypothetical protein